ncbi:hypothetical protein HK097_009448 [Rhizophlyctis rosea]|uniref:Uncharacterized protein n=1 Tax=Rhizophlyctis rosea TaxID=64517 RepID=A0AAD5SAJ0_9FUNG|nr:hypothetical protein HK097_009448 [Rhizophlyctis rosea]
MKTLNLPIALAILSFATLAQSYTLKSISLEVYSAKTCTGKPTTTNMEIDKCYKDEGFSTKVSQFGWDYVYVVCTDSTDCTKGCDSSMFYLDECYGSPHGASKFVGIYKNQNPAPQHIPTRSPTELAKSRYRELYVMIAGVLLFVAAVRCGILTRIQDAFTKRKSEKVSVL